MKVIRMMFFLSMLTPLSNLQVVAQNRRQLETPLWVTMMDDAHVNYYDAIRTYESYWKTHTKPAGEDEDMEQVSANIRDEKEQEREREEKREKHASRKLTGASLEQAEYLKYQSKRFENWAREAKLWIQQDGHILSAEERMNIWKKQKAESR